MTPLRTRDARTVADAWNRSVPDRYRIDADLVETNLLGHPLLHEEASLWDEEGFVAVKRSAATLYDGPDPKVAHLSLLGGAPTLPERAIRTAADILRREGYDALALGGDGGHFLPGAPIDVPWMGALKGLGFERGGLAFDLERDLGTLRTDLSRPRDDERRALDGANVASLERFLRREFPGRWTHDVMRKVAAEGPGTVFGLLLDGEVAGFALLQREGCALPIGGAVWRGDLGSGWGSLGPIGVSRSLRGSGYGTALLETALFHLATEGARRTIIDWTGLVDFYGAQGFNVARTYRHYRLSLRAGRGSGG